MFWQLLATELYAICKKKTQTGVEKTMKPGFDEDRLDKELDKDFFEKDSTPDFSAHLDSCRRDPNDSLPEQDETDDRR